MTDAPSRSSPFLEPSSPNGRILATAGLLALTGLVYLPAFYAGIVWDDGNVFDNPFVQSPDGLGPIWLSTRLIDYYPLTWSLYWGLWQLFGASPFAFHAVAVGLHGLSALMAWSVLRALAVPGAFLAALVFAVHPVAVDTAAWISETKTTLAFVFFGLALLAHLRFQEGRGGVWYAAALLLFALSLLAKTSGVMLPALLLLLAWWCRGKTGRADLLGSLPFFALSAVLGLLTVHHQEVYAIGSLDVRPEGLLSRLAATGWCLGFYAWKLLVPLGLSAVYPRWDVDPAWPPAWLPLLAVLGVLALAWRHRGGWGRPVFFALASYTLILAPILGLVPFGFHRYSLVADHFQYPGMIAPIALGVAGALQGLRRLQIPPDRLAPLALAALAVLSFLSFQRAAVYQNHGTLWSDTLAKNPESWMAHYNLGLHALHQGETGRALRHLRASLEIHEENARTHINLALALKREGRLDESLDHLRRAVEIDPRNAIAHNNLGNLLRARGDRDGAIHHFRRALEIAPGLEETRKNLERMLEEAAGR